MSFLRWGLGVGCAILCSMSAVACGGAVDGSASGPASEGETTGTWSAMLTCDDGATLAVDRNDPTSLELVVKNEEASRALAMHVDRAQNSVGEIVVVGKARVPVEGAGSFDRFVDESGRYDRASSIGISDLGARPRIVAEVRRSAVDRVTLAFQEVTVSRTCSGTVEGRYCRGAEWVETREIAELASWSFNGCK